MRAVEKIFDAMFLNLFSSPVSLNYSVRIQSGVLHTPVVRQDTGCVQRAEITQLTRHPRQAQFLPASALAQEIRRARRRRAA